jgi:APA family basic amino acid/polyamine antiporter
MPQNASIDFWRAPFNPLIKMTESQNETHPRLQPRLGLFSTMMVVVGSIIGSGIFKKIAPMSLKLQSESWVLACWAVAGLITLLGALTYAEIAARLAQTGGLYAYLRTMYGRPVAFLFGWSCFSVIQSASIASIAFVFAEAFLRIFAMDTSAVATKETAVAIILILTTINCAGLFFGAWLENIFSILKVSGIGLVTTMAFIAPVGSAKPPASSVFLHQPQGFALAAAFFGALMSAFWAFDGLNNIGFIGGEVRNPRRNVPRALIFGVALIVVIYLLINKAYFHALGLPEILGIAKDTDKIFAVELLQRIYGTSWASFVTILIMVSTLGATNGSILTSARIYFAMANDGLFFRWAGYVHPRTHTPILSLFAQGIWASGLVFMGSFDELTDLLIFASFIFYGMGAAGLFGLRKKSRGYEGFCIPSAIPVFYILFCVVLVAVTVGSDPTRAGRGLLLILAGLPLYAVLWRRPRLAMDA